VELLISAQADKDGTRNSARFSLDGALTLGRGPESPLLLDGTGISREHIRLHSEGDGLFITDLSSNGTWLNTRRLTRGEPHPLQPADAIKIPGFEIRIDLPDIPAVNSQHAAAIVVPEAAAEPVQAKGPLASLRAFGASLSKVERLLIALALVTFTLVALYFAS
jgi:predicted component of type VI protein secretion system